MGRISLFRWILLVGGLCAVFLTHLGSARLWDRDEPRNSRASHEMLDRGDWIVPTFNGELRDHKPILLYWGQMATYLVLGESEFSARLPSVICALMTLCAVGLLASRLSGKARGFSADGFWAMAALGTSLLFVMAGRAATPDACLVAFSTLGITSLVIASLRPAPPFSVGNVGAARWLPAIFGYVMLGLAVLAKGPVGIILPLAVVNVWWLICFRFQNSVTQPTDDQPASSAAQRIWFSFRELWSTFNPWRCCQAVWALKVIPGVALCLLAAAPWYLAVGMETNGEFLRGFFWEHNVGRAVSSMEGHSGSIFFYPVALLVGTFPWSLWLIPMLIWANRAAKNCVMQRQMVVLAGVWIAVYVGAFTIASTKLPSYITPCYAGAALVIGSYWRQFESEWAVPTLNWRRVAYLVIFTVGLGITGTIVWLSQQESMPLLLRASSAGLVISVVGIVSLIWDLQKKVQRVPMTCLAGAIAFQTILFGFGSKSVDSYRSDLATILEVDSQAPSDHWLTIGGMEPSWVHYLGKEITEVREHPANGQTWLKVQSFLEQHPDGYVVVVGDLAHDSLKLLKELNPQDEHSERLELVSQGNRFLRPGSLSIYQLREDQAANRNPTQSAADGAKTIVR